MLITQASDEPSGSSLHETPSDINLLEDSLGYAIKRAQVRVYEILFSILGPDALSPGRMTALCIIGNQPGVNQTELAEMLGITRAGAVKVIDTLQQLGYVERHAIPGNRRSYALAATDKGLAELKRLTQLNRQCEQAISSQLSAQERQTLLALLEKVAVSG